MGRPINKRNFGDPADGTNLTVSAFVDGEVDHQAYIVNQKGTNKFTVSNNAGTVTAVCRLSEATPLSAGLMTIAGMNEAGETVKIKKLFNRTAVDYTSNSNRYTWELEDDSTNTVIRLTAI